MINGRKRYRITLYIEAMCMKCLLLFSFFFFFLYTCNSRNVCFNDVRGGFPTIEMAREISLTR